VTATSAEISAFAAEHLADRWERRRGAIEQALAALSESRSGGAGLAAGEARTAPPRFTQAPKHDVPLKALIAVGLILAVATGIGFFALRPKDPGPTSFVTTAAETFRVPAPMTSLLAPSRALPPIAHTSPSAPALTASAMIGVEPTTGMATTDRRMPAASAVKRSKTLGKPRPIDDGF
jgi:hypothetical protein